MIYLFEILVPTIMDGKPVRTRFHKVWDKKVQDIAGGLSILKPIKGKWVSPDKELFTERMIPVRIACTLSQIVEIADLTASYYNQKAVMYYRISDFVIIKEYDAKETQKKD